MLIEATQNHAFCFWQQISEFDEMSQSDDDGDSSDDEDGEDGGNY